MNWKSILLGFVVGIVFCVVSFLIFSIYLFGNLDASIEKANQVKIVGEKFQVLTDSIPAIPVAAPNQMVTISPAKSDLVILNFWATWCGPCKKEMPVFQALVKKAPGVKFYFLSDEPIDKQLQTIQKAGWSLPFFKADTITTKRFTSLLPTTYVIKKGVVVLKLEGEHDWGNPRVVDVLERLK